MGTDLFLPFSEKQICPHFYPNLYPIHILKSPWQLIAASAAFTTIVIKVGWFQVVVPASGKHGQRLFRSEHRNRHHKLDAFSHSGRRNTDYLVALATRQSWQILQGKHQHPAFVGNGHDQVVFVIIYHACRQHLGALRQVKNVFSPTCSCCVNPPALPQNRNRHRKPVALLACHRRWPGLQKWLRRVASLFPVSGSPWPLAEGNV